MAHGEQKGLFLQSTTIEVCQSHASDTDSGVCQDLASDTLVVNSLVLYPPQGDCVRTLVLRTSSLNVSQVVPAAIPKLSKLS